MRLDDALTALQERTTREVVFAAGFSFDGSNETSLAEEAVTVAADAAAVVLFLGLPAAAESEGFDRTHLQLPESQLRLAASVLAVNPNVVVVLSNGGVVTLEGIAGRTPAILEMWLGGQASGSAAADILLGIAEPGGRLAETIPHTWHTPPPT
ncbi:glycoside hydrolase family 3 protein [Paenarthrobacter ureafaciens]|uniref:glycoside hydrolase family 3 protein n=1 Tax=Paenarthrobacter ureafaciens TaxID=37931 RepID=UPI001F608556|nr:glycoside hydrolase family 3 C-terminal domain-containing protein [Paenarthrobacter ureafaciens]